MDIRKIIKLKAKEHKIYIFFDMDGVLANYDSNDYFPDFLHKRPIKTAIKVFKTFNKMKNVEVGIVSQCRTNQDKADKIAWLKKYIPFVNFDNVHILSYENIDITKVDKHRLKTNLLLNMFRGQEEYVYHIDDDIRVIKIMKETKINVLHVSSIIK